MDIEVSLRNYRCVGDSPASIRYRDGFTALVGVNNSGKSTLLRLPYEVRPLLSAMRSYGEQDLRATAGPSSWWQPVLGEGERISRAGAAGPVEIAITVRDGPGGAFELEGRPLTAVFRYDRQRAFRAELKHDGRVLAPEEAQSISTFEPFLAATDILAGAKYIGPFRNALNIGAQESYYDIQIGRTFVATFNTYKAGPEASKNEAMVELLDEVRRIFGYAKLDANATPGGETLQLSVDGRSFRLSELGAGFAHFLVVLVNVLVQKPELLLIDEPELNLHASLQLDFLSTLARYATHGVVFATHSLGLARTSADNLYVVDRDQGGGQCRVSPYESGRGLPTLVGQLGFDGRPDLGFEQVLLVEGKTEVRTLLQFLRLYGKEHKVALVPLGGGELIGRDSNVELRELQRLGSVKYLIDSERRYEGGPLGPQHQEFVDLCSSIGLPGHVLLRRALENYLSQSALDATFGSGTKVALGPYDKFERSNGWPKTRNWAVGAHMSRADLDGTDLGQFLNSL